MKTILGGFLILFLFGFSTQSFSAEKKEESSKTSQSDLLKNTPPLFQSVIKEKEEDSRDNKNESGSTGDINKPDSHGETPLILEALFGDEAAVKLLLDNGAKVNLEDHNGETALIAACLNGKASLVRLLLDHDAKVNGQDHNGNTALMYASSLGHEEIVRILLSHGAQVKLMDRLGETANSVAASNHHSEIEKVLKDAEDRR